MEELGALLGNSDKCAKATLMEGHFFLRSRRNKKITKGDIKGPYPLLGSSKLALLLRAHMHSKSTTRTMLPVAAAS